MSRWRVGEKEKTNRREERWWTRAGAQGGVRTREVFTASFEYTGRIEMRTVPVLYGVSLLRFCFGNNRRTPSHNQASQFKRSRAKPSRAEPSKLKPSQAKPPHHAEHRCASSVKAKFGLFRPPRLRLLPPSLLRPRPLRPPPNPRRYWRSFPVGQARSPPYRGGEHHLRHRTDTDV